MRQGAGGRDVRLRFLHPCKTLGCGARIEFDPGALAEPVLECPRCHERTSLHLNGVLTEDRRLIACPMCGCPELFVRKDFPPVVGISIVVAAGLLSVWFLKSNSALSYGILAGAVLVDAALYLLFPKVTVCYRCRTELRGAKLNPAHGAFDLATQEKYN